MSQSEAFEKSISRSDKSTLVGKLINTSTLSTTPSVVLSIGPNGLSPRTVAFAALFSEYHINYLRFKFLDAVGSASTVLGVLDDSTNAEGDGPTSFGGVLELRCSASSLLGATVPTEFMYTQRASTFWLKTYAGASGSDPRLAVAGLLYGAATATANVTVEVDFSITFRNAVDVSSSVAIPPSDQFQLVERGTLSSFPKPSSGFPPPTRPLR
jgi:hypothetical protein